MGIFMFDKGVYEKTWTTTWFWGRFNIEKRGDSGACMSCDSPYSCSTIQIRSCVGKY